MRLMLSLLLLAVALSSPVFAEPYDKARVVARTGIWKEINSGAAGSATVAIMDGGKVVYAEGFGMADRERSVPVDPQTIFNIGSISKVFTATAIMLLVDDGKVRLDEPVTTYLPEFRMADPRYRDITVRMLLDHSSGLPGTTGQNDFGFRYNPDVFPQILANLAQSHLKHAPGAFAPYTNDGFSLAEMVVERVSGQRFLDFLAQRVFTPLAMPDTGAGVGDRPGRTAAAWYDPKTGAGSRSRRSRCWARAASARRRSTCAASRTASRAADRRSCRPRPWRRCGRSNRRRSRAASGTAPWPSAWAGT